MPPENRPSQAAFTTATVGHLNILTVTFLPIATSSADERDPSIIALGDGRFLVAYEKIAGSERRLAGRFVDFGNRRRAVR